MGDVISLSKSFQARQLKNELPRHNVNFLIFSPEGEIYVFERFCRKSLIASGQADPCHPDVEKWHDIPGGRVDYPEDNIDAILRENFEELGIYVKASLHLTDMVNPSPNCMAGSRRSIYVVTDFDGELQNKAGMGEGHLGLKAVSPSEASRLLGYKIDEETHEFLQKMAGDFFLKFCRRNQTQLVPDNTMIHAIPAP